MIENILLSLFGIFLGVIAGVTPGIGPSIIMTVSIALLYQLDTIQLLIFYVSVLCTCQYIGSVVAITFGVPGESSSMPAVKEGFPLALQGKSDQAIATTAIGSLIGATISVLIFIILLPVVNWLFKIWNNNFQTMIFLFALSMLVFSSTNKKSLSIITMCIGFCIGMIGLNPVLHTDWLTFNQPMLYGGIPLITGIIGLYAVPELYKASQLKYETKQKVTVGFRDFLHLITMASKRFLLMIKVSAMGFVCGLVPALTTQLASNLSYSLQKLSEIKKGTYQKGNLNCLIAAETANNSASFSSLLPMIILGIPITASEAIVYEFISLSKDTIDFNWMMINSEMLLGFYIFANLICFILAWPACRLVLMLLSIPKVLMRVLIVMMITMPVIYLGWHVDMMTLYIGSTVFCGIVGWLFRKQDTLPMTFAFIVATLFLESFYRFYVINIQ